MNKQYSKAALKPTSSRLCRARFAVALIIFVMIPLIKTVAHEGPPFPIIIDQEVGPYLVSVWTDPDIGIGTFFVVFESNPSAPNVSDEIRSVKVAVQPVSGRLAEAVYDAEAQGTRRGARYFTEVEFDKGEVWDVRVAIEGDGWSRELNSEVLATPDGTIGPISLVIYAIPFILVGILWIRAMIERSKKEPVNE